MMRDRQARGAVALVLAAFVGATAVAGTAGAQGGDPAGSAELSVGGPAQKRLDRERVKLKGADGRTLPLVVSQGTVTSIAQMDFAGELVLTSRHRGGKREARVTDVRGVLSSDRSFMTGSLKGTRYTLWTLEGIPEGAYDPITGDVDFSGAKVKTNGSFATAVDRRLKSNGALRKNLGRLDIDATLEPVDQGLQSPPVLERPTGAVDVTGASITWRYRESFVDYIHAGGPTSGFTASDGATAGAPEVIPPSSQARSYQFDYTWTDGFSAGAETAGEVTGLNFDGKVRIAKPVNPFNIDLDAQDVEVELNGDDSRLIALLDGRLSNADQVNRRAVAVDLDPGAVTPTVTDNGDSTTYEYQRIPATTPSGEETWPIADFYNPGTDWGWVSVSYTVPDGGAVAP